MPDLRIACTLGPAALKARREGRLNDLVGRGELRLELTNGCRLRFQASDDILSAIARAVDAEGQCRRFVRFTVTVEPDGGPILVDLTGPPGTRKLLARMFEEP